MHKTRWFLPPLPDYAPGQCPNLFGRIQSPNPCTTESQVSNSVLSHEHHLYDIVRSVIIPDAYQGLHLKLGVGVKLTSAVRTISPESAYLGPCFSSQVVPVLTMDRNILTVAPVQNN